MRAADHAAGERILAAATRAVASWGAAEVQTRLLEGSPKHEIHALLNAEGADTLVVFVRGREVGPKSIHKEARFLIDHAPCPVLVVKG
jgi:nucleotide-binding universal stress UspA family protein